MSCFRMAVALIFLYASSVSAASVLTFEGFADGDILTNQIPGLTFSAAQIVSAGISLNEFEFPPKSGVNAAVDLGGPLRVDFSVPVPLFSAYFSYSLPLTLQAFDASNNLLAVAVSAFGSNAALSGDPGSTPNELLLVAASDIAYVTITGGDPGGSSFALDDVAISAVAEPSTLALLLAGSVLLKSARRRRTT